MDHHIAYRHKRETRNDDDDDEDDENDGNDDGHHLIMIADVSQGRVAGVPYNGNNPLAGAAVDETLTRDLSISGVVYLL